MSTPARLAGFVAVTALVFGAAALAGGAADPDPPGDRAVEMRDEHAMAPEPGGQGAMAEQHPVRGLAVAQDGLRLQLADDELRRGAAERLRFRIVGPGGRAVRDFDRRHERRMHLIVVRRDTTGFQHLHPHMTAGGTWTVPLRLAEAGSYRVFADFTRDGEPFTLASDLRVDGAADLRALPAPAPAAAAGDGYRVRLDGAPVRAGRAAELRFGVTKAGAPVRVERYLGAGGHLVALREGDLAFLHVHPTGDRAAAFEATFPTPGRYRLFLQFKHDGRVHTAAFTQEVS